MKTTIDTALGVQINDENLTLGFSLAGSTGVVLTLLPSDHTALIAAGLVITETCRQGKLPPLPWHGRWPWLRCGHGWLNRIRRLVWMCCAWVGGSTWPPRSWVRVPRLCLSQARRPETGKAGAAAAAHEEVFGWECNASFQSGRQYSHDAFIRGELDIPVANSVNPAVVGPYWDWVKAADKAAEEARCHGRASPERPWRSCNEAAGRCL